MFAVRASPHSFTPSAWMMPAPGLAPNDARAGPRQPGAVERARRDPTAVIAANEDRAHGARVGGAAASDQARQESARRHLDDTAVVDGTGQGDEHAAGVGLVAHRPEPARSEPGDQRDMGQGFDVVDQRGPSPHPRYRGDDLAVARQRRAALDSPDDRGLFPRDERVGRLDHSDLVPIEPGRPSLVEGIRHRRHDVRGHIEIDRVGSDRLSGAVKAVEHQMRCSVEKDGVLAAQRFAFGAVGHYDRPAAGDRGDLAAGRESRRRRAPTDRPGQSTRPTPRRRLGAVCRIADDVRRVRVPARRTDGAWAAVRQCGAAMSSWAPGVSRVGVLGVVGAQPPHQGGGHDQCTTPGERQKPFVVGIGTIADRVCQGDRP